MFLGVKKCKLVVQTDTVFSIPILNSILSVCTCHWVCKTQRKLARLFLLGPVVSAKWLLASVQRNPLPGGDLFQSHLQSHRETEQFLWAFLCLSGCKRITSRFKPSLHCCSSPHRLTSWAEPPQVSTPKGLLGGSSHLLNLEGGPSDGHQHVLL